MNDVNNVLAMLKEEIIKLSSPPAREGLGEGSISDAWDFKDEVLYSEVALPGINEVVVRQISKSNGEPEWMLELRLRALEIYQKKEMPHWGPDLSKLDLDGIYYFAKPK